MPLDKDLFDDIDPDNTKSNPSLNRIYDAIKSDVNEDIWMEQTEYARALLVAHSCAMFARGGASGSIRKEKVGMLEREFSENSKDDSALGSTSYGKEFKRIRKKLTKSPFFTC